MFTSDAAQRFLTEPGKIDAIKVVAADGVSDRELVDRIAKAVPAHTQVLTGAEITAEQQREVKDGLSFFSIFLLTFAVIALFVGSFIIYNSFSILVAQRSKEMALLRAIGASRRQVLGSVLLEAVAVGLIASLAGIVAGIGVASALKALLGTIGLDIPAGGIVLTSKTVVISIVAGLGVSVASAVFPARKAAKVPPIAAMRDVAIDSSGSSRRRMVIGSAVGGLGAVRHGCRTVRWCGRRDAGARCAAGVRRCGDPRSGARSSDQQDARVAAAAGQGHGRHARSGERDAQSQADVGDRSRADDRCRVGELHHHPRFVDQGVGQPGCRHPVHR